MVEDIIRFTQLPGSSARLLSEVTTSMEFPKGSILVNRGDVCRDVYIIVKGMARAYHNVDIEERNFWIGAEGEYIFSPSSITLGKPSPDHRDAGPLRAVPL